MITRYSLFKTADNDEMRDEYLIRLRTLYTGVMVLLGIQEIELERLSANDVTKAIVKKVEFHEGATEGIRIYAEMMLPFIGEAFSTIGVAKVSTEFNDKDKKTYEALWKSSTDETINKNAADSALKYAQDVAMHPDRLISVDAPEMKTERDESSAKNAFDDAVTEGADGITVINHNKDAKAFYVYEQIAELLPIEGRDYDLNPTVNDNGGVHMDPVAYTKIGKIWLEYLREVLPEYSMASDEEKQKILTRPWNYGEQK